MFVDHLCAFFLCLFVIEKVKCQEVDCSIPDGSVGVCVQIDDCPSIRSLLLGSARPLPSHVITPKVCCLDDIFTTEVSITPTPFQPITPSQVTPTENQPSPSTSGPDLDLGSRSDLPDDASDHPNLNLLPLTNCGDILEQKLSNGNKTDLFEFPWMALLRYENGGNIESLCGGSLISDRYVLTAAHCVTKLKSTMRLVAVRLGEYDTTTDIDCQIVGNEKICAPPVQDILIEEVFAHPLYDRPRYSNDIAVIRLSAPANMTPESVRPICLPTTFRVQSTVLKRVSITGWGTTETQRPATVLLQALMPIVPNDICQKNFYKRSLRLTANQMCAGGETGIDSCKGDSGGPLIYPATLDGVRMVQFGIVSAGVSVCSNTNNFPGIYVKVAYYMRWILDQMRP
ncbi:hypothetical protein HA402_006274 [Bradysia odoriphaga]|nr:hypothetical protein HA402_006274 [Bradysia odoriphaga]